MPEIELNCQNLPCPQPVLRCKRCLDEQSPASLVVVVDNQAARENVTRFLSTQGYAVQVEAISPDAGDGLWRLRGVKGDAPAQAVSNAPWQCLYFLPEPHGQGSLRPTRPQVEGSFGSRSSGATKGRPAKAVAEPSAKSFWPVVASR